MNDVYVYRRAMAINFVSLSSACRLCLIIGPGNVSILEHSKRKPAFEQKLWKYFSISVHTGDMYPKNICPKCIGQIEHFSRFCAKVEKMQKIIASMFSSCTSLGPPKIVEAKDNLKGFYKVVCDPLNPKKNISAINDNDRHLQLCKANQKTAGVNMNLTSGQTAFSNSQPLLIISNNSVVQNNTTAQTELCDPSQKRHIPVVDGNANVQNKSNLNAQPKLQTIPNLVENKVASLQGPKQRPLLPAISGNSGIQHIQTLLLNPSLTTPHMVVGANTSVQNKVNLNVPTQLQNLNPTAPIFLVSGNSYAQNKMNINIQPHLQNLNQMPQFLVISNPTVQNKLNLEDTQRQLSSADQSSRPSDTGGCTVQDKKESNTSTRHSSKDCLRDTTSDTKSGSEFDSDYVYMDSDEEYLEHTKQEADLAAFYNFSCSFCKSEKKKFRKYVLLDRHCQKEHYKRAVIECCGRQMMGEYSLKQHMKKHTQCIKCPVCGKQLSNKSALKNHVVRHLPDEKWPYRCEKCGKGFTRRVYLQSHGNTHLTDKQKFIHLCHMCGKKFTTARSRDNHVQYYHERKHNIICHICPKTFPSHSDLHRHLESHSSEGGCEKCPKCCKVLKNKRSLRKHMKLHDNKGSYSCPHCEKMFTTAGRLRSHVRCHQDSRPQQVQA